MFNWCFIGTGRLGHFVAKQILPTGRHNIVSCYTRNFENAKEYAQKFNCVAYESAEEAMKAPGVQAVYICTTHNAHYRYAKMALEMGIPVFLEKAFTVEAKETDELIKLAGSKNVFLAEAMWTWFSPAANKVKEWVDGKLLGPVKSAQFTLNTMGINYAPRVADPKRAGGALLDLTIYPLTYAYRLWGMPLSIASKGVIQNGVDYSDEIELSYDNGLKVTITASLADESNDVNMNIICEKGLIYAPFYHFKNKVMFKDNEGNITSFSGPGPEDNSYLDEFDTVAKEITAGLKESRMVPLKATQDVMHMIDIIGKQINLHYDELE